MGVTSNVFAVSLNMLTPAENGMRGRSGLLEQYKNEDQGCGHGHGSESPKVSSDKVETI